MKRKRIIGMIIVKDGLAVQSFGFSRYLPLGKPEIIAENLERWEADAIGIISIDRKNKGPDLALISKVAKNVYGTPLIYGGGISTPEEAISAINHGAERIIVDSLLFDSPITSEIITQKIGKQALIASIPFRIYKNKLLHYNYLGKTFDEISTKLLKAINSNVFSELLLINKDEGGVSAYPTNIISFLKMIKIKTPIIAFGSIDNINDMRHLLKQDQISAIAIGNSLNYKENNIFNLKNNLSDLFLRPINI